jgi:hypothetical protein
MMNILYELLSILSVLVIVIASVILRAGTPSSVQPRPRIFDPVTGLPSNDPVPIENTLSEWMRNLSGAARRRLFQVLVTVLFFQILATGLRYANNQESMRRAEVARFRTESALNERITELRERNTELSEQLHRFSAEVAQRDHEEQVRVSAEFSADQLLARFQSWVVISEEALDEIYFNIEHGIRNPSASPEADTKFLASVEAILVQQLWNTEAAAMEILGVPVNLESDKQSILSAQWIKVAKFESLPEEEKQELRLLQARAWVDRMQLAYSRAVGAGEIR